MQPARQVAAKRRRRSSNLHYHLPLARHQTKRPTPGTKHARSYVFRGLTLRGFNARAWAAAEPTRARRALAAVGRLAAAGLFSLEFTEYEFGETRAGSGARAGAAPSERAHAGTNARVCRSARRPPRTSCARTSSPPRPVSEWADAVEHAAGDAGGPRGGSRALMMMPGLPALGGGAARG